MGELPNGWIETTLENVVNTANTGLDAIKRAPIVLEDTGIKCFRIQDASQSKSYEKWGFTNVSKQNYKKFKLLKGDILIARTGNSVGVNFLVKKDTIAVFNNGIIRLKVNNKVRFDFLYKIIHSQFFARYIKSIAYGTSTQPNIQINALLNFTLLLPPLPEQKSIANILTAFDEKIDLLQKLNETLETLAQTIFKEWFINFNYPDTTGEMVDSEIGKIPREWRVGKLGEVTSIKGGGTPSTKNENFWNGNIYWTRPKDLSNSKSTFLLNTEKKITKEGLKKISSGLLPKGTLLLSSRAPIGYLALSNINISINQGYIALTDNNFFSNYFMYLWLKTNIKTVTNAANGSIFPEISKTAFKNILCLIPSEKVLKNFDNLIEAHFNKILLNQLQIQALVKTRKALLPKLISGEIRVEGFEQ